MSVTEQIESILAERRRALPRVQRLASAARALAEAGDRIVDTARSLADEEHGEELLAWVREAAGQSLSTVYAEAISALTAVEARLKRTTVNIGVSGQARVGKSTLLQSISGLGDEQIPTGSGLPVTAVRSRIFHAAQRPEAVLQMHSWTSFREEVLVPYHRALNIREPARTLSEFGRHSYEVRVAPTDDRPSQTATWRKLREIHGAFGSFAPFLGEVAAERHVSIDSLREFVAYPKAADQNRLDAPRSYLAVRDVRIFVPFPRNPVEHLGLVDLPGLGELNPDAEIRHVDQLRNEVDLVLIIKRPLEGAAFWKEEDARAMDLLDAARGAAKRSQFMLLLLNDSGESEELKEALLGDIRRQVNDGEDGRHIRVLIGDVKSSEVVHTKIVPEMLEHLAEALPQMDRAVLRDAESKLLTATKVALVWLKSFDNAVRALTVTSRSDLVERADQFQKDVASRLEDVVAFFLRKARTEDEDEGFITAIDDCAKEAYSWIEGGFGATADRWKENALKTALRDRNSVPHASLELNRIRVEISQRFSALDVHLNARIERVFQALADALGEVMGAALSAGTGRDRMLRFKDMLERAEEPLPALQKAVDDLLSVRFEYRSQIHPRVRRVLDALNVEIADPATGERRSQVQAVEISAEGVEVLFRQIRDLAERAVYETRGSIMSEALLPALVEHAAAEQFVDSLIRSKTSAREFRLLVAACEDDIWPGVAQASRRRGAAIGTLRRERRELGERLESLRSEVEQ